MNHDQIIEWATDLGLDVQHTTQGPMEDGWPTTMLTGALEDPLGVAREFFDEPDQGVDVRGGRAYRFEDDRVVLLVLEGDEWLHAFLYDTDDDAARGWETQSQIDPDATDGAEPGV